MVIGNGLMGKAFKSLKLNSEILVFASGVSNSSTNDSQEFEREKKMLLNAIYTYANKKIIYFSTCSVYDVSISNSAYVKHKLEMEAIVIQHCNDYIIFRTSNVVGKIGNPNTMINYFVKAVVNSENIEVWKYAQRNIIDIDDVKFIVNKIINAGAKNRTVNIAVRKSEFVSDILHQVEKYLNKTTTKIVIHKGSKLEIDISEISDELAVIESIKGNGSEYIYNILKKYY